METIKGLPEGAPFVKFPSRLATVAFLLLVIGLPGVARGAEMDMKANLDAFTSMRDAGIEMANKPPMILSIDPARALHPPCTHGRW